jgi:hypothetical protein
MHLTLCDVTGTQVSGVGHTDRAVTDPRGQLLEGAGRAPWGPDGFGYSRMKPS